MVVASFQTEKAEHSIAGDSGKLASRVEPTRTPSAQAAPGSSRSLG